MANPPISLLKELAKTENYLVIKELVNLFPKIVYERYSPLFKEALIKEGMWDKYNFFDVPDDTYLDIADSTYLGDNFFRFTIYVGDEDKNWWFGIRGPWDRTTDFPDISKLIDTCSKFELESWSKFRFKYFNTKRSLVLEMLESGNNVSSSMESMAKQFIGTCTPIKVYIDKINLRVNSS